MLSALISEIPPANVGSLSFPNTYVFMTTKALVEARWSSFQTRQSLPSPLSTVTFVAAWGQALSLSLEVYSSLSTFCLAQFQSLPHNTASVKGPSNRDSSLKIPQHSGCSPGSSLNSLTGHQRALVGQAFLSGVHPLASNDPRPCCLLPSAASSLKEM